MPGTVQLKTDIFQLQNMLVAALVAITTLLCSLLCAVQHVLSLITVMQCVDTTLIYPHV